jgi:serine/threonine-protein phosphatase 2B catalytic subunit
MSVRENSAVIEELRGLHPNRKIPHGLLLEGTDALKDAVEAFANTKKWDIVNEKRPSK